MFFFKVCFIQELPLPMHVSVFRTTFSFYPLDDVSEELICWGGACSPVGGCCCCAGFLRLSRSGKGNLQNLLVQSLVALEIEITQVLST